ncbi:hypothetical protein EYR38_007128 [Pleurotus pulmonarius]|nr:hypothetical protein EYR38_007128 [Pleurotus pulmonarius]
MNLPQHPSYDYGYTSGPPYSDQDVSPSNGDTASQIPTLLTPTSSHPGLTPKYAYLRHPVTPSIGGPPSPPTTPSTRNTSLPSSASRLNTDAPTFIPGRWLTKVSIQDPIPGIEPEIEDRRRGSPPPLPLHTPFAYPAPRQPIRLESESAKRKRVAEERQRKAKAEVDRTAKQAEQPKEGETDLKRVEEGIIPEEQAVLRKHKDDEVKERSPHKQEDPSRDTGNGGEGEQAEAPTMSEADARKKIDQDVKALFDRRDLDEAEACFSHLPSTYHEYLVDQLVLTAIKSNEADATLVANFFARAASNNLCSSTSFEAGFVGVAEFLEVIAINTPKAWDLMAILINGAALNNAGQRRIASKTTDADRLLHNLCVATLGGNEGRVQPLDSSASHLYSSSGTSGSAFPKSSICIEPQQKVDEAVDGLQHAKPHNPPSVVPSDMQQLYASQIEEYRSREATWVEEVKFLRQQVVVWQELYRQSEKERKNLIRQQRLVDEVMDRSLPSDS